MKKTIHSILLGCVLTATLSFFSSCEKAEDIINNTSDVYYVKFKADGNEIKYTYTAGSINGAVTGGGYSGAAGGQKAEFVTDKNTVLIDFSTANLAVVNTTYTNYQTSAAGYVRATLCLIGWHDTNGGFFGSWGDEFAFTGVVSDTKLKFTEITPAYLKGTFSGTVYKQINGSSEKHVISDGEFFVKR